MKETAICLLCCLTACGMADLGQGFHSNSDGIWVGPNVPDPSNVCYLTAVDYPPGYDWRSDPGDGSVKSNLMLFADGIPVLKIPVGKEYMVSSDQQRHRVLDGHLYTDYTDSVHTVVKKDGRLLYSYDCAETVDLMLVRKGKAHTLCTPLAGGGFRYRVDGQLMLERSTGQYYSQFTILGDTVCFFFSQKIMTEGGLKENTYCVKDGKVSKMDFGSDVSKVWDVTLRNGKVYAVVSYEDGTGPVLLNGDKKEIVNYFLSQNMMYCRFMDSERVCVNARCIYATSNYMSDFLWFEDAFWHLYRTAQPLSCIYVDDDSFNATINPEGSWLGLIFKGTRVHDMPEGYFVRGRNPMVKKDSLLMVGLTSKTGGPPLVWIDESLDTLDVNGYITGMAISKR